MDRSWMHLRNRLMSTQYAEGVEQFLTVARAHAMGTNRIRCPCRSCYNNIFLPIPEVETHLFLNGINPNYNPWIFHREDEILDVSDDNLPASPSDEDEYIDDMEQMLDDIREGTFMGEVDDDAGPRVHPPIGEATPSFSFDKLLDDARRPLYQGCKHFSKLSFIVKLLHIKAIGGWSIKSFDLLLKLLRTAFPDAHFPLSYEAARSLERDLGFKYHKIHACPNDCVLFWKDNADMNECPKCNAPRWLPNTHSNRLIPQKVLRHFPLIPRLQRLYMSPKISADMRWHKEHSLSEGGTLRHPADAQVWTTFDSDHSWFAADARNIRLGLASDGFNPFNNLAKPYSIWPVILVPYNLPPWFCMKDQFFITSLIIPGPKSPGNEIDVYLQPLVDELNELWENGVHTYDAYKKETFRLHAVLLWTINDFPAYGNLSGWSTKGKLACPSCNSDTDSMWLTFGRKHCYMGHRRFLPANHVWRKKKSCFNGKDDHRMPPNRLSGPDIVRQLSLLGDVEFGKGRKKRKRTAEELNWTKRSIFYNLPYWSSLQVRHNLDVMHIEKNICDNILGTLMNIPGKSKDNINSRRDLANLGLRKELHLTQHGDRCLMPHACFTLNGEERKMFCEWLADVKFPDGFAANISRCVSVRDCKISAMKSHDCHIFLQRLLPIAVGGCLRNDVAQPLIELSQFFKEICARTLSVDSLAKLESDIVLILCKLEMIFSPSFFDVMVHLALHLPREALLAGPVQYRWMYPFERFLGRFKRYVKNKARPEGSIAEAYIHVECLTFCSMYLDDIETRFNRPDRNIDGLDNERVAGFSIFTQKVRPLGVASPIQYDPQLLSSACWYVLNNCTEIAAYIDEHYRLCKEKNPMLADETHRLEFAAWFKKRVQTMREHTPTEVADDLYALACGPESQVRSYAACIVNGKRFHTKHREQRRRVQNSGVLVTGDEQANNLDFYGVLNDVIELHYMGWRPVYLFSCDWFDVGDRRRGVRVDSHMTSVNLARTWYKDEPFVLACQAEQCFYVKDRRVKGSWYVVQKFMNRNVYDIPQVHINEDHETSSSDGEAYQDEESESFPLNVDCADVGVATPLHRPDIQPFEFDGSTLVGSSGQQPLARDFIDDAEIESGSDSGVGIQSCSDLEETDYDDDVESDEE